MVNSPGTGDVSIVNKLEPLEHDFYLSVFPNHRHHTVGVMRGLAAQRSFNLIHGGDALEARDLKELEDVARDAGAKQVGFQAQFGLAAEYGFDVGEKGGVVGIWGDKTSGSEADLRKILGENDKRKIILADKHGFEPEMSDRDFARNLVIPAQEMIAEGRACQVVLSRAFYNELKQGGPMDAFCKMLDIPGSEQVSIFSYEKDGKRRCSVWASPEIHLTVHSQQRDQMMEHFARMRPIAGTENIKKILDEILKEYVGGEIDVEKARQDLITKVVAFLQNPKEIFELMMVLDEHLKQMCKICKSGKIRGPYIRQSGHAIHTEFEILGVLDDIQNLLSEKLSQTLYASTLIGGPRDEVFKIIKELERTDRGSYGTFTGILDPSNIRQLFTTINIRGFEFEYDDSTDRWTAIGRAGAGIVRDSDPMKEAAETTTKISGPIAALSGFEMNDPIDVSWTLSESDVIKDELAERRKMLNRFFRDRLHGKIELTSYILDKLKDKNITIIDNNDDFSYMQKMILESAGAHVTIVKYSDYYRRHTQNSERRTEDLTIIGPGPGSVTDYSCEKMQMLHEITDEILEGEIPVFGVCLGHQLIAQSMAGDEVVRKLSTPNQGVGQTEAKFLYEIGAEDTFDVASYNSFGVDANDEELAKYFRFTKEPDGDDEIVVHMRLKNHHNGNGLPKIGGTQKHLESIGSPHGAEIFCRLIANMF